MDDRVRELEAKVSDLSRRVQRLEASLRAAPAPAPDAAFAATVPHQAAEGGPGLAAIAPILTYSGRTFLVLGGAFLVRALTEQHVLSPGPGVAVGLAFAAAWIGAAHWAVLKGHRLSAGFHGFAAALVAYPLVWETTTRLGAVPARTAAGVVALFTALLLAVAWKGNLRVLAWGAVAAALGTAVALLRTSEAGAAFPLVLLGLAVGTWWLGESRGWTGLRWPVALLLDFVVLRGVVLATRANELRGDPAFTLVMCCAVAALSIAALAYRTIGRELPVMPFEGAQALISLAIAATGAVLAAGPLGTGTGWAGGVALVLAVASLFVALRVIPHHKDRGADFAFYSTVGLALLFVGGALVADEPVRSPLWAAFALLAALLGRRMQPTPLWTNAAALAWGAAVASGLAAAIWDGFAGAADRPWTSPTASIAAVVALSVAAYALTVAPSPGEAHVSGNTWLPRVPAGALLVLDVLAICGLALHAEHAALGARGTPAVLAAARMVTLVAAAFGLAAVRHRLLRAELAWAAYALLALGAIKLPAQDLREGSPLTLLVSFGTYGAALILVPRLIRGARAREPKAAPAAKPAEAPAPALGPAPAPAPEVIPAKSAKPRAG